MNLFFHKYHGNGNDFIIIDDRRKTFPAGDEQLINKLCHRNFGIGADGLMLLQEKPGIDFHMQYFNSDGREGSMCGNGGRCIVHYARGLGLFSGSAIFSGIDGMHEGWIDDLEMVHLKMSDVDGVLRDGKAYVIDTGSPHYVEVCHNLERTDVIAGGKRIRYSPGYREKGINVNFIENRSGILYIRTYERGVENETMACGTGAVAAALAASLEGLVRPGTVRVKTSGGDLEVRFKKTGETKFTAIWLTGPATPVFKGNIDIGLF